MDYSKAKIYKIYNNIDDDIYVGATCCSLSKRMAKHRCGAKQSRTQHYKLYSKMNRLGVEHFFIELIFEYPECQNVEQLRKKEGEYIRKLKPILNHVISGRTHQEWIDENKEYKNNLDKDYYHKHKDEKREERKQYYQEKRETILNDLKQKCQWNFCGKILSKSFFNKHIKKQHS